MLRRKKQLKADYETTFGTDAGKRVLADLCGRHFVFSSAMVPGDPYHTHYNDGRRSVVTDLMSFLSVSVAELEQLERQSHDRDRDLGDDY